MTICNQWSAKSNSWHIKLTNSQEILVAFKRHAVAHILCWLAQLRINIVRCLRSDGFLDLHRHHTLANHHMACLSKATVPHLVQPLLGPFSLPAVQGHFSIAANLDMHLASVMDRDKMCPGS